MSIFNKKKPVVIQATEGGKDEVALESLLTGSVVNTSIPGTINAYKNYESQVAETFKKYNGQSDFGVSQTRAVIDLRSAMISGEGISISTQDDNLSKWIEDLLRENKISTGGHLSRAVKSSEMTGQALYKLDYDNGKVLIRRAIQKTGKGYYPNYPANGVFECDPDKIMIDKKTEKGTEKKVLFSKDFIYIRTGGDDTSSYGPTTRTGVVLTDIENYDRAIKDMRRNNHVFARITPVFETETDDAAKSLIKKLGATKWKIGKAFAGTAKFRYETPDGGAHENLSTELTATIKNISATTGVPVHWMGFVDLMSNRSTSDSLYEMIKHATVMERIAWEDGLYNIILKAQEMYIDAGNSDLKYNPDFQVRLPLLDYSGFLERVRALQIAYADQAISIDDYMNFIPGVDPLKTAKAVKNENAALVESIKPTAPEVEEINKEENDV
jgi:hypothetical protein